MAIPSILVPPRSIPIRMSLQHYTSHRQFGHPASSFEQFHKEARSSYTMNLSKRPAGMSIHASYASSTMWDATLTLVVLASAVACSGSHGPPPLPRGAAVTASQPTSVAKPIEFRTSGGTPIAPVVIADDPAPAVAQPVAGPQNVPSSTLNGDPHGLTREVLNRALQGAVSSVASCFSPSSKIRWRPSPSRLIQAAGPAWCA